MRMEGGLLAGYGEVGMDFGVAETDTRKRRLVWAPNREVKTVPRLLKKLSFCSSVWAPIAVDAEERECSERELELKNSLLMTRRLTGSAHCIGLCLPRKPDCLSMIVFCCFMAPASLLQLPAARAC